VRLAERISAVVAALGLPSRISAFDLDRANLPEVAALLKTNYPEEVADLGDGAPARLDALLEGLW
jgi:hypothetical protein